AVDAVGTFISARTLGVGYRRAGNDPAHDVGDLADTVILGRDPDVEDLAVHGLAWRLDCREEGAADIGDMNDRPPGHAVALQEDTLAGERVGDKVVQNQIETDARREAVGGRAAQQYRREFVARQRQQPAL